MTNELPDPAADNLRYLASVNVYGAGIAGLSAAHELMVRGFKVRVIESDVAMDPHGQRDMAIGGLARNQYLEAPKLLSPRWWEINKAAAWTAAAPDRETDLPIRFATGKARLSGGARDTLRQAAEALRSKYGPVSLEITSYAGDGEQELSSQRAQAVKKALSTDLPDLRDRHFHTAVETAEPQEERHGLVTVRVRQVILPGEHGFHFFPGYYRHLFDTMRRTPLLDEAGAETGRSAYDNLTVAPHQSFAVQFPHSRTTDETLDYLQLTMRIRRYLTTCPARRAADFEDISWWQYLTGWNPLTRTSLYIYSPAFGNGVKFSGRVLAAFDAQWGDARTNGDTFIQLEVPSWTGGQTFDGILDGGETDRWFEPWRRYLRSRGVELVSARLEGFELVEGKLRAIIQPTDTPVFEIDQDADYFVSATDVVSAERVTARLPKIGVPGSLSGYTTIVPPCPLSQTEPFLPGARETCVRDPLREPGLRDWDRLQTLSGIQYFFTNQFNLVNGYMYFTDALWALSSINPQQFWTRRPTLETDGYIAVMSVDIGDWNRPSKTPSLRGKTAWECTRDEIAREVWRQVTTSLLRRESDLLLPQPVWYNLDQNIVFEDPDGPPSMNLTPYQIPIVGDWRNRPLGDPWDPTPTLPNLYHRLPYLAPGLWQAWHGGYLVHWSKLVFAGTYMRTFTRMTTMESANESARHAVNAILDHLIAERYRKEILERVLPPAAEPNGELNSNFNRNFPRPSPVGDYCQIWNPEENEIPSLLPERDYDALRFSLGLPHIYDSLGVELPLSAASYRRAIANGWWPPQPDAATAAAEAADAASSLPSTEALFETLAKVRAILEEDAAFQIRHPTEP
jgi:hypothetical protein